MSDMFLKAVSFGLHRSAGLRLVEPEIQGLKQVVGPGDVCFDIGAAYGMYSFPLAELVGKWGAVYSFEPQKKPHWIFSSLARAMRNRNLSITRGAVGENSIRKTVAVPVRFGFPIHGHAHVVDSEHPGSGSTAAGRVRTVGVDTFSVDEMRERMGIRRVDFMKIDVEGYEPSVLAGAEETLNRFMPSLLMEIEKRHLDRYGVEPEKFVRRLLDRGYGMYFWGGGSWRETAFMVDGVRNYLFVHRRR
ncbi:methyltransferase, FkbM family [Actinopolyspora xinjiangensis]|uniref:Methyltransferase, FkbM family n=1 Tax=Actinopolyspora xinjiangensis TaxID=405564 RepID=A0A1H0NIQ5_9ACTN|nr:methyltransferase, FkbM family [Actinopolyspora xinjiangensis]